MSIVALNIVVLKVVRHGFTQVKKAHTKLDWLIKVKLCLLHVNGNEIFVQFAVGSNSFPTYSLLTLA